jgi:hypothetical protein
MYNGSSLLEREINMTDDELKQAAQVSMMLESKIEELVIKAIANHINEVHALLWTSASPNAHNYLNFKQSVIEILRQQLNKF